MMITIIVVCAVLASNAFQRTRQASEALSVVVLKRATLLPKTTLRNELGLERANLLMTEKASAESLQEIISLHASAEKSLDVWETQVQNHDHAGDGAVLNGTLRKRVGYAKLWKAVLAAMQQPRSARPPELGKIGRASCRERV